MKQEMGPKVCIGLPIYNEALFLEQSLRSLVSQSYRNIEVIISDNDSSDGSGKICREYAAVDPRVLYHKYDSNKGVTVNSRRVLELAEGDYFMWASGHDLWSADLVRNCVAILEANPSATVAYANSIWIAENGSEIPASSGVYDTSGMSSVGRFFMAFWGNMHPVLGVIRMSSIKAIPKIHGCVGSDLLVLSELALQGDILLASDAVWSRREVRGVETFKQKIVRYKSADFSLVSSRMDRYLPLLRLPIELVRIIFRARISFTEKFSLLLALPFSLVARFVEGGR